MIDMLNGGMRKSRKLKMRIAIDVSSLKSPHKFRGVGSYTKRLIQALRSIKQPDFSVRLIEKGRIPQDVDVVHYPYFDLFFLTLPIKKIKPTLVTIHDLIPLVFPDKFPQGIRGWIKYQVQRQSLRRVDAIITDSECSKKDIIKFIGFPKEKIYVVPLAPGEEFKKMRIKKNYSLPKRFVLYVGDVNYNKNIPGLVQACDKIGVPLVIVGKQAKSHDYDKIHPENQDLVWLQNYYQRPKIKGQRLILAGFVPTEDLVVIYNLATCYCQPSFYEGFGLPVLEAMACGTPVVVADTSSLSEIGGDAAIMVNPYDINEVAKGIKKAMTDKMTREKLIKKGLAQAKNFSWEKTAKETVKAYHEVLKEK